MSSDMTQSPLELAHVALDAIQRARDARARGDHFEAELSATEAQAALFLATELRKPSAPRNVSTSSIADAVATGENLPPLAAGHACGGEGHSRTHDVAESPPGCGHTHHATTSPPRSIGVRAIVAALVAVLALIAIGTLFKVPAMLGWRNGDHDHAKGVETASTVTGSRDETLWTETPAYNRVPMLGAASVSPIGGGTYLGLSAPGTTPGLNALTPTVVLAPAAVQPASGAEQPKPPTSEPAPALLPPGSLQSSASAPPLVPTPQSVLAQPDPNLATLVEELTKFFADGPAAAQHLRNVRSEFRAKLGQSDYSDPFLKLQLNTRRKIFCERYHNLGNAYQHLERTHRLLAGSSATGELHLANPDDFLTNDQIFFDLRFAVEDAQRAIAAGNDVPLLTQQLVLIAYILKDRERAISSFWDEFARYDGRSDTKTR